MSRCSFPPSWVTVHRLDSNAALDTDLCLCLPHGLYVMDTNNYDL